jgi:hypothetical protein
MNNSWRLADLAPAHPLERFTRPPAPSSLAPACPPLPEASTREALAYIDVFVGDFLALRQGFPRHIFHSLDLLFRPNDARDRHRKTSNSIKKLKLGDADWTTHKKLLGSLVDSVRCLISLPADRYAKLLRLLDQCPRSAKRCTLLSW